ncbi:MAG TPA: glycoside hydrolase family 2 protein, partial [Candidatus Hydrogenedentes bacterium]|nr:glycoside hydrolase family 2 protein [Candidatus Hydrogenedentota bacterium]
MQWVGREDWTYSRQFQVPPAFLDEKSIFLNCESLDTAAAVFINNRRVASTLNMFVRRRFEVRKFLRAGLNDIRVEFASPAKAAAAVARNLPYPVPPAEPLHRNLLRKVQCHAGWDWGPCLMVSGIAGPIYLGATSEGRIEYVAATQKHARN